ncbi:Uncharacterised protein [uncultured archaeon]|nr:Uncharacterised protein [uncultured archaeon]
MQLPRGKVLREALPLEKTDMPKLFYELELKRFNGYLAAMVRGKDNFEEGIVIFVDGRVVSASYEYLTFEKEFFGIAAIKRFANLCRSESGVYDIIQLPKELCSLILRLNPESEIKYSHDKLRDDAKGMFDYSLEQEARVAKTVSKEDVLKKLKITDIIDKR